MKVLITGSRGFIGSTLAKTITCLGHIPVGVDREINQYGSTIYGLFHQANFEDEYVAQIVSDLKIDTICHLAADASVPHSVQNPGLYYENNVAATIKLLNNLAKKKWKGNFIFSSSAAVYPDSGSRVSEDILPNPPNPYGRTKWIGEQILYDFHYSHDINVVCFRYFNVSGAWDDVGDHGSSEHVIQKIIQSSIRDKSFFIYGDNKNTADGTCVRDYIHVRDVCGAHLKAIEFLKTNPGYYIFNLGTGNGYSIKQLITHFIGSTGQSLHFEVDKSREGDPDSLVADGSLFIKKTGYTYQYSDLNSIFTSAWQYNKRMEKQYHGFVV